VSRERALSPEDRLNFHQEHSGPLMKGLHEWMEAIDDVNAPCLFEDTTPLRGREQSAGFLAPKPDGGPS
jgi:hypothetical protein